MALLDQAMSVKVVAYTEESDLPATLDLSISYFSDGPSFESALTIPPITCSKEDESWSIELPEIAAES